MVEKNKDSVERREVTSGAAARVYCVGENNSALLFDLASTVLLAVRFPTAKESFDFQREDINSLPHTVHVKLATTWGPCVVSI